MVKVFPRLLKLWIAIVAIAMNFGDAQQLFVDDNDNIIDVGIKPRQRGKQKAPKEKKELSTSERFPIGKRYESIEAFKQDVYGFAYEEYYEATIAEGKA
jgi:hypothetical protein